MQDHQSEDPRDFWLEMEVSGWLSAIAGTTQIGKGRSFHVDGHSFSKARMDPSVVILQGDVFRLHAFTRITIKS